MAEKKRGRRPRCADVGSNVVLLARRTAAYGLRGPLHQARQRRADTGRRALATDVAPARCRDGSHGDCRHGDGDVTFERRLIFHRRQR